MWEQRSALSTWFVSQLRELIAATRFLSIIPIPGSDRFFETDDDVVDSPPIMGSAYFSLVGFVIALLLCLLPFFLGPHMPSLVLGALVVIGLVLLTGGLHLDGLMDSLDGLFGGTTERHKLEIMRDSRVGSFGVLGAICVLLLKFAVFASLGFHALPTALFVVLPTSRWAVVLAVSLFPSVRPNGLGAAFRQSITRRRVLIAGAVALVIALVLGQLVGLAAWIIGTLVALGIAWWITNNIGGLTGDTYGAIEEITEVAAFFIFALIHLWS